VIGLASKDEADIPAEVPKFGCGLSKSELSGEWRRLSSFLDTFETLKQHGIGIVPGVDSADVLAFVGCVEVMEQSRE
jgi:hypothetical protein